MPDGLRQHFIALLSQPLPCLVCGRTQRCRCARPKDSPSDAERRADLLLAVRDEELEQLRAALARLRADQPDRNDK